LFFQTGYVDGLFFERFMIGRYLPAFDQIGLQYMEMVAIESVIQPVDIVG
jgi:hypothetical protein